MTTETGDTAFLVMDVQPGIVDRLPDKEGYLAQVKRAVAAAHEKRLLVIRVVVGFRPGFPEVSPRNKMFSALQDAGGAFTQAKPAINPNGDDIIVTKRRVSAFSGSDLEMLLRARGISHLVLSGIATSGVVLSTVREAADKDYQLTVLADLCADFDEEVHRLLIDKVFPKQAEVTTSKAWIGSA